MKRRTAITAIPLAIAGVTAAAKGAVTSIGVIPANKGVLDERALSYVLEHLTDASKTDLSCTFIAFAQHIAVLASIGDCETINAVAERLTDCLFAEHNYYEETRKEWISEEMDLLAEYIEMDDDTLPRAVRNHAFQQADIRHARRSGEGEA